MKFLQFLFLSLFIITSCTTAEKSVDLPEEPFVVILGTAQDAGYPQAGCEASCCLRVYENEEHGRMVSCIAVVDPISNEKWIFDATPDFPDQLRLLNTFSSSNELPEGIFLTHAHIGHYTGLIHLGREVMGTNEVPVYAAPKMARYLATNGPWSQLLTLKNIDLKVQHPNVTLQLNDRIRVTPVQVPHRDEYSETVGYEIQLQSKKILFIPDINKWETWDVSIVDYVRKVDVALLDGSFFEDGEIKNRPMSEIPHPFVSESMAMFDVLGEAERSKIRFIHFNHTNPLLIDGSEAQQRVLDKGYGIAQQGKVLAF